MTLSQLPRIKQFICILRLIINVLKSSNIFNENKGFSIVAFEAHPVVVCASVMLKFLLKDLNRPYVFSLGDFFLEVSIITRTLYFYTRNW